MSRGIPHTAVRNISIWGVVMTLLPAALHAGATNTPPDPNATPTVKSSPTQVSKLPTPRPVSQAVPRPSAPKLAPKPMLKPGARTPAAFTREMPLSEAIEILRTCTTPPLNIVVLWRDLDNVGIYPETPIGIDGLPGLRLRQYLDMLVASLSAGTPEKIDYVVHHGLITIATTPALPVSKQITRVYDITDLTSPPSNPMMGYGGFYGGQMTGPTGGLGMGYGMGSPYMSGGYYGTGGAGGFPGLYGGAGMGASPGMYRGR